MSHRKTFMASMLMLLIILMASCSAGGREPGAPRMGKVYTVEEGDIHVSFRQKQNPAVRSIATFSASDESLLPDEYVRKDIDRSQPHIDMTPSYLIAGIHRIHLYDPADPKHPEGGCTNNLSILNDKVEGLEMVNMLSGKGMPCADLSKIPESSWKKEWDGFEMDMRPGSGNVYMPSGVYFGGSYIGTELPEGINVRDVQNATTAEQLDNLAGVHLGLDPSLAWFDYRALCPAGNNRMIMSIAFQTGTEKAYVVNPGRTDMDFAMGPSNHGNGAVGIALPMKEPIDLSNIEKPVITLECDAEDMVSLYRSSNGNGYVAVLNLSDPYPYTLSCGEYDQNEEFEVGKPVLSIEEARPILCTKTKTKDGTYALQFVMPNYGDIDHMEITHSFTDDPETATVIYSGLANVLCHDVSFDWDRNHYWAYTVDTKGKRSYPTPFTLFDHEGNGNPGKDDRFTIRIQKGSVADPAKIDTRTLDYINPDFEHHLDKIPFCCVTPEEFFLRIRELELFMLKDGTYPTDGTENNTSMYMSVSRQMDMLSENVSEIRTSGYMKDNGWDGISIRLNPDYSEGKGSYITLRLPDGITREMVHHALPAPSVSAHAGDDRYATFALSDLIPLQFNRLIDIRFSRGLTGGLWIRPSAKYEHDACTAWIPIDNEIQVHRKDGLDINTDPTDLVVFYEEKDKDGNTMYRPALNMKDPMPFSLKQK